MKKVTFVSGLVLVVLFVSPALKSQTGSASGMAGGSRVDFLFPAQLNAGKYAVIPLPDQMSPVSLTDDGTVILRKIGMGGDEIGYRWKAGQLSPLRVPAGFLPGFMPFPLTFQTTRNGWVLASFFRFPGPPSTAVLVWPPGETEAVRLMAPQLVVDGFEPLELIFNPAVNAEGRIWAQVAFPDEEGNFPVKFATWFSLFGLPEMLEPDGQAITVAGVNAAGTLIGTYTPDADDPSSTRGFVGAVGDAVDFEPRLINDAGWVVGVRPDVPGQNILWKDGEEVVLPSGDILEIDSRDNLHGYAADGKHVMWTTDLLTHVSDPGSGTYRSIDYVSPILPEGWTSDVEVIPGDSGMRLGYGVYRDPGDAEAAGQTRPILLVPAELAADASRDSKLKLARETASDITSVDQPFRFWINDDDDSGDTGGNDVSDGTNPAANCNDQVVNGTRDLVDFFPVFLDLKQLLAVLPPVASINYKLKQADGALNFVYTNLTRDRALAYHKELFPSGFGDSFSHRPGAAATHRITAQGVELSSAFLEGAENLDGGVLLIEGRAPSAAPLILAVEKDGTTITEMKLDLRLSNVEDMFRHVDLTHVPTEYNGQAITPPGSRPSRTADPGEPLPDSLSNGKYFVFLHGFNIDGRRARGWEAEVFKRMFVLGSHARFVGVNWAGAAGPEIGGVYPDYQKAVFQAFQTGDVLAEQLSFTGSADVTVAAHSLGNMVVSHAIQYAQFAPARYYMINSAVALEAYDLGSVTPDQRERMTHVAWKNPPLSNGDGRFFAANWHKLFDELTDHRSELKWKERFKGILTKTAVHDFYSPGDDVVADPTTSNPSILIAIMAQGFNLSRSAWATQELSKGTVGIASLFFERTQAGWGESGYSIGQPDETNPSDASLKVQPFFYPFYDIPDDLVNPNASVASAKAGLKNVQYDTLARGIPALSFAVAVHLLDSLNAANRNFDMEQFGRISGVWPTEAHLGANSGRWLHSDFKNVALPYVHKMYRAMVDKGSLQ